MKKIQLFILLIGTLIYGQRPVDLVNPLSILPTPDGSFFPLPPVPLEWSI